MLTYGVYRNGQLLTRAGLRKGVLTAMLTWVSGEGKKGNKSPDELGQRSRLGPRPIAFARTA
jgi:hypothetical protein